MTRGVSLSSICSVLLSMVLIATTGLIGGCTTDGTSRRDYEPWKKSAEGKLRRKDISADQLSPGTGSGEVTDEEIKQLRASKTYVRKNLPVRDIKWTYKLKNAAPIVQTWLGPQYIYAETEDFHLWAINRNTGEPVWQFTLHGRIDFRPTFVRGIPQQKIQLRQKIEQLESDLASARTVDNRQKIQQITSDLDVARNKRQELVNADRLYLVVGTTMYVLDREFGSQLHRMQLDFSPASRPFATRNRVIIPGQYRHYVHFIDSSSFTELISERVRMEDSIEVPIRATGNLFLLSSSRGTLYALNENQEWEWLKKTDGPISAPPRTWKDRILLASEGMQIYALSKFTGENLWTRQLETPVKTSPWVSPPHLYVRDDKQRFHAFTIDEGDKSWTRTEGPRSFLFRNGSQIITHNPRTKKTFTLSDDSGKTLSTGRYDRFDYIFTNNRNPVFLLGTREGTFVAARASKIGLAWDKVGPDPNKTDDTSESD